MKKRIISLALAATMVVSLAACRSTEPAADPTTAAPSAATEAAGAETSADAGSDAAATEAAGTEAAAEEGRRIEITDNFKIGILTGTASQGDEEITQANEMKAKYGDMIITATYPDNFTQETETVISNAVAMASDPDVKAIIWCQAVPGTAAAIDKVRDALT